MTLNHVYSISQISKNNLIWDEDRKRVIYTSGSIVIIEDLNEQKTQRFLSEGNDPIYSLEISINKKFLLGFTREGHIDGTPMIYIWELSTLKKRAQISINQPVLKSVKFSLNSNLLLVLSSEESEDSSLSVIGVWDFLEDYAECLC